MSAPMATLAAEERGGLALDHPHVFVHADDGPRLKAEVQVLPFGEGQTRLREAIERGQRRGGHRRRAAQALHRGKGQCKHAVADVDGLGHPP